MSRRPFIEAGNYVHLETAVGVRTVLVTGIARQPTGYDQHIYGRIYNKGRLVGAGSWPFSALVQP